jgi:hypothetical protein
MPSLYVISFVLSCMPALSPGAFLKLSVSTVVRVLRLRPARVLALLVLPFGGKLRAILSARAAPGPERLRAASLSALFIESYLDALSTTRGAAIQEAHSSLVPIGFAGGGLLAHPSHPG